MPSPTRSAASSRIGKSLGAILSTPRRPDPGLPDAPEPAEVDSPIGDSRVAAVAAPDVSTRDDSHTAGGAKATQQAPASDRHPGTRRSTRANAGLPPSPPPGTGSTKPTSESSDATPSASHTIAESPVTTDGQGSAKKRETFLVPADLADKMRDAIVHLSGPPMYFTLAEFGEHAIRCYLDQLERDHNGGNAFPPRPRGVRQGRPLR